MMGVPVIEVIGVLAVIAGLVFVGLEIRQTNRLAQAAAYQVIGSATAQNWHDMSQDPEFNRIWLRHFSADQAWWSDQDPRDVERLISAWIGFLRQYETIHLQIDLGLLDEVAMERLGWGLVRDQPALQYLWPHVGYAVDPTFAAHITETWSEVPPLTGQLHLGP
jgi:hypothetical protein